MVKSYLNINLHLSVVLIELELLFVMQEIKFMVCEEASCWVSVSYLYQAVALNHKQATCTYLKFEIVKTYSRMHCYFAAPVKLNIFISSHSEMSEHFITIWLSNSPEEIPS